MLGDQADTATVVNLSVLVDGIRTTDFSGGKLSLQNTDLGIENKASKFTTVSTI